MPEAKETHMAETAEKPSRADTVRTERRRTPGATVHSGIKLAVDEKHLDRNTYAYRWVNDRGTRVKNMEANDWDVAPIDGRSTEKRVVGFDSGRPTNAVLMRKRKDWHAEDQKQKRKPLDEMEAAIKRGVAHSNEADLRGGIAYTPGTNTIDRGEPATGVSLKD
jgi:hypothetical protein